MANRERRRLYGGLPRLFDAIRSSFASSKRRVMELDALLDELTRTNARASVSAHTTMMPRRISKENINPACSCGVNGSSVSSMGSTLV